MKYKKRPVVSTSARSTPVHRRQPNALGPAKSTECFEKSNYPHKMASRSNTVETYVNSVCVCICVYMSVCMCMCVSVCMCVLYMGVV